MRKGLAVNIWTLRFWKAVHEEMVFKFKSTITIITFEVMDNHFHFVLIGSSGDIDAEVELPGLLYGYEDAPYRDFTFRNVKCNQGLDIRSAENVRIEGGGLEVRYNGF